MARERQNAEGDTRSLGESCIGGSRTETALVRSLGNEDPWSPRLDVALAVTLNSIAAVGARADEAGQPGTFVPPEAAETERQAGPSRGLRGDGHVQFTTSLLRGLILLAFDQKHNAVDPAEMPELDLASLRLEPLPADDAIMKDRPLGPLAA